MTKQNWTGTEPLSDIQLCNGHALHCPARIHHHQSVHNEKKERKRGPIKRSNWANNRAERREWRENWTKKKKKNSRKERKEDGGGGGDGKMHDGDTNWW